MIVNSVTLSSIKVAICDIFAILLMALVKVYLLSAREIELALPKLGADEAVEMGQLVGGAGSPARAVDRKQECEVAF